MQNTPSNTLREKYEFPSDILELVIGGKSAVDVNNPFPIQSLENADQFLRSYGYDLDNPIEKAEILGIYHESLNFIRTHFLHPENPDGLRLEIPRKILELSDVRELFPMANLSFPGQMPDTPGQFLRNWACALLKVMHTICHIDKDVRTTYFVDIQKQIFDRFYRIIQRDPEGRLFLGLKPDDPNRVNLNAFQTKPKKSRVSTILKLLHKPENVAEDIFDRVGIRFVTATRLDALRVIRYLRDQMVIMPPNIKPSRSRNSLIAIESLKPKLEEILSTLSTKSGDPLSQSSLQLEDKIDQELEKACQASSPSPENPHSSEHYRAIQFTCRQLIKLQNPLYNELRELKMLIRSTPNQDELSDVQKLVENINLQYVQREIRFFYPFEIQVMDVKSAEQNERGVSAHSEYKKAQVVTALKRVMGCFPDGP